MNIAIVDDVQKETAEFTEAVREYGALNRTGIEVTAFVSAEDFFADYFPLRYTLIVLDIFMDGMTGLEATERIKEMDRNALIVFLSSSEEHYPEAFRLHAFDFLNKPASKERIFRLLDDITARTTKVNGGTAQFHHEDNEFFSEV
ncbi:MAG: response regulator, partial [Ruminiclostridium sp.]|nr:response regulator [Ruminiclostridium sp.]